MNGTSSGRPLRKIAAAAPAPGPEAGSVGGRQGLWKGLAGIMLSFVPVLHAGELPLPDPASRPNILLIISDDLRDRLACYGNSEVKTPHIDGLASRGVRFDRAYNQYSVCGPSRTSFLTGLRPEETRIWDNKSFFRDVLPEVVTMPQCLRDSGYHTSSYGKVFHTLGGDAGSIAHWSDASLSWDDCHEPEFRGDGEAYHREDSGESNPRGKPTIIEGRNLTGGRLKWCEWGATAGPDELEPDAKSVGSAIEAMDRKGDEPWFIAAGLYRPHDPFIAPKQYFDLYPLDTLTDARDPEGISRAPDLALPLGSDREVFKGFNDQDRLEYLRGYYACLSFMDAQVGRLLEALRERGLEENTIVIFMSDNGFHLGERDWWNKVTLFERCCRVPLIMAGPGIAEGEVCEAMVELVDLYPTLVDLGGAKAPAGQKLAGVSMLPLLKDPSGAGKGYALSMVTRGPSALLGRSVRTPRWRYTEWDQGRQGIELYDHSTDPEETKDLSKSPEHREIIASLKSHFSQLPELP